MTSISRVERPSLLAVSATVDSGVSNLGRQPDLSGSTQQRHQARVSQQYALAQYAASQQFASQQRTLHPDGNLPPVRAYLSDRPEPAATKEDAFDPIRDLLKLRSTSVLTDAEFVTAVAKLVGR
jgi:hypothetical protein